MGEFSLVVAGDHPAARQVLERELAMLPGRCALGVVHRLLAVLRVHSGI
jgi:hypothetical protein